MNKIMTLFATAAVVLACNTATVPANAQDKTAQANVKTYGEAISADGAISTSELAKVMGEKTEYTTKVEGEVITSCAVKGCWMDMKMADGSTMKVRFKDYGFFVPKTGLEGKRAVIQGTATREVVDVATLKHYAEDAGKSKEEIAKITEPQNKLMFLADGVLITF
ncbi:MAG TPA: DUF4920 domain-containing protein [Flavobacteriales bacterium]|jgi:hypothetical protein|nr:DUF4920 domain-containing protein [Flavobacteriales bacterium]